MPTLAGFWASVWNGRAQPPLAVPIPSAQVLNQTVPAQPLVPRCDYFQVTINELFLTHARKGMTTVAPLVVAVSEFNHAQERVTIPCIVGPGHLKAVTGQQDPKGMVYDGMRVAGIHPYTGGTLTLAVILCRVPIDDFGGRFLRVLEAMSSSFSFATALGSYVKMGTALLTGVNDLLGLGTTVPLVGWQQNFDHDSNRPLLPGYFALINGEFALDSLWVKGDKLYRGTRDEHAAFRDADYVLFSLAGVPNARRNDLDQMDWWPLWQRVMNDARQAGEDALQSLKANFASLSQSILASPHLTDIQAAELVDNYFKEAQRLRDEAKTRTFRAGQRGPELDQDDKNKALPNAEASRQEAARKRSLDAFLIK